MDLLRLAGRSRERDREAQHTIERLTPREPEMLQALVFALRHGVVEIG